MTPDFTRKPTLEGELVVLRPATAADAVPLRAGLADVETARLTGAIHSAEEDFTARWPVAELEAVYARWATADDRIVWAIVERSTGAVVGESVLNDLDAASLSCGFRIWISGARDRGLGTEATRLTMRHAFDEQGLNRVGLEVFDFNPRARRVYEKVGFVLEGTRREALRYDGSWVDAHDMAILAREWRAHRGQPELDPIPRG
ncbi:GNAT family protein [Intrasporangium sp.]|uniref:GNAT family N-acetyltransferase n=1 Tax=Intrasporangium sp. TaxID=1925024 RepID=UPI0033655FAC